MPSFLSNIITTGFHSHCKLWISAKAETGVGPRGAWLGTVRDTWACSLVMSKGPGIDSHLNRIEVSTVSLVSWGGGGEFSN